MDKIDTGRGRNGLKNKSFRRINIRINIRNAGVIEKNLDMLIIK
jgi:hypothetical protein